MKRLFLSVLLSGICTAVSSFSLINDTDKVQSVRTINGVTELAPGKVLVLRNHHVFRWAGWTFKVDDDRLLSISELGDVTRQKNYFIDLDNLIEYDLIKDS